MNFQIVSTLQGMSTKFGGFRISTTNITISTFLGHDIEFGGIIVKSKRIDFWGTKFGGWTALQQRFELYQNAKFRDTMPNFSDLGALLTKLFITNNEYNGLMPNFGGIITIWIVLSTPRSPEKPVPTLVVSLFTV